MRKKLYLLFSFILLTSCQSTTSEPAIADPSIKVENRSYGCDFYEDPVYILNKDYVIYQDCHTHEIITPDLASFGIKTIGKEGFAFDKNGIFVKGEFLKVDTAGFAFLGNNQKMDLWWKNKTKVFKNITELKGAAADTFPRNPSKRKNTVFNNNDSNRIIIDYNFYKKDNTIYFKDKQTDFDAETFMPINQSHEYYKDKDVVFYRDDFKGIQKLKDVDINSAAIFNNFLTDKNYLYYKNIKIIKSSEIELLAIFPGYRSGCGFDSEPTSNFYLFKNSEGFWLVKISKIISYRFLGKVFDRNWDPAFKIIDLAKKYGNIRNNSAKEAVEAQIKQPEVYNPGVVETLPKYSGGIKKLHAFLKKNYVIPKEVIKNEENAHAIFATFVIETDGTISDIKILRDFGYGSGKELVRVLKLSRGWIPATKEGKAVRCLYSMPYYCK